MVSRKTAILAIAVIVAELFFIGTYCFSMENSLFFNQPHVNSVKVYWRYIITNETMFASGAFFDVLIPNMIFPNYTISDASLRIIDAFHENNSTLIIVFEDFTYNTNFIVNIGQNSFYSNDTAIKEYKQNNPPDILVDCSYFKENIGFWSQITAQIHDDFRVKSEPFFTQTSLDTWQAYFLFDDSYTTIEQFNGNYCTANVNKVTLNLDLPQNYNIQSSDKDITRTEAANGFTIGVVLEPKRSINIVVIDTNATPLKSVLSIISYIGMPGIIIALVVEKSVSKFRKKTQGRRTNTRFYSPIHVMIVRINTKVPRQTALQTTVGIWVNAAEIGLDYKIIANTFTKNMAKFTDEDLKKWIMIESQIKNQFTGGGFWVGRDVQEWLDDLERRFNH